MVRPEKGKGVCVCVYMCGGVWGVRVNRGTPFVSSSTCTVDWCAVVVMPPAIVCFIVMYANPIAAGDAVIRAARIDSELACLEGGVAICCWGGERWEEVEGSARRC